MKTKTELVNTSVFFAGLKPEELEPIIKLIIEKKYERDEMLFFEGDATESLIFLASGVVKIFKTSPDGKEQILSIAHPEETLNELPLFNGGLNATSAQAMMRVVVYMINKRDIEMLMRKYPLVASNVIHILAKRTRRLVTLVEELSFKRVNGRLAGILLENAVREGQSGARLTQRDMAAMAGTAREVISRSLKAMEDDGVIGFDKHKLIIKDREALKIISQTYS
ncbi:MAG: Crp/Fnr family transcriptional regulator [Dehalococcoidales bacterium]|jgi:CRP/FNR family transcriptional regulator|nr:Crp/Fnr family transcriptional regulator [Dehalococcoidales bacterium]